MIRFSVALVVCFAAAIGSAQNPKMSSDEKLQTHLSLRLKNTALVDFAKNISTRTKAKIIIPLNLQQEKISVFIQDEPANKMLDKVADVLMCDWVSTDDGGYRLTFPNEMVSYRKTYLEKEDQFYRAEALKELTTLAKDASVPYRTLLAEKAQLDEELKPSNPNQSKPSPLRLKQLETEYRSVVTKLEPARYAIGQLFLTISPANLAKFWDGSAMMVNLPSTTPPGPPRPTRIQTNTDGSAPTMLFLKYSPILRTIQTTGNYRFTPAATPAALLERGIPKKLADLPFSKSILEWAKYAPDPADKRLTSPFQVKSTLSLADALEQVFESTKSPIVADGSRSTFSVSLSSDSIADFARSLSGEMGCYAKVDGSYLEVRHKRFWRVQKEEIPEAKFVKIEKAAAESKLNLDAFAEFLDGLSQVQIESCVPWAVIRYEWAKPLEKWSGIQAYASLKPTARASAKLQTGFAYLMMDATQRDMFASAIYESVFVANPQNAMTTLQLANDPRMLRGFTLTVQPYPGSASNGGEAISIVLGRAEGNVTYLVPVAIGS